MIDLIIILIIVFISLSFSSFNLAPESLGKILYNSDFKESNIEDDDSLENDSQLNESESDEKNDVEVKEDFLDTSEVEDDYSDDIKRSSKNLIKEILRDE